MAKTALIGVRAIILHKLVGEAYSPGIQNAGARGITREVSQEITNFFADNVIYDTQEGVKTIAGELTSYHFEEQVWTDFFGFQKEDKGGFSDGANKSYGAITVIMDLKNVENQTMGYRVGTLYKNKFGEPTLSQTTSEDAVEYTELASAYSGIESNIKGKNGRNISYYWFDSAPGVTLDDLIEFILPTPVLPTSELPVSSDTEAPVFDTTSTTISSWTTAMDGTKVFSDIISECGVVVTDNVDGVVTNNVKYFIGATEHLGTDLVDLATIGTISVDLKCSDTALNESTEAITIEVTI